MVWLMGLLGFCVLMVVAVVVVVLSRCFPVSETSTGLQPSSKMLQEVLHQFEMPENKNVVERSQISVICDDVVLLTENIGTSEASSCSGWYDHGGGCHTLFGTPQKGYDSGGGNGNDNKNEDDLEKESSENKCCFDEGSFSSSDPFASTDASALSPLLEDQILGNPTITTMDYSSTAPLFEPQTSLLEDPHAQMGQIMVSDPIMNCYPPVSASFVNAHPPLFPFPAAFKDDSVVQTLPGYLGLEPSLPPLPCSPCSFLNQTRTGKGGFSTRSLGMPVTGKDIIFPENFVVGRDRMEQLAKTIEYQAEDGGLEGLYGIGSNQFRTVYGSGDLMIAAQALRHGKHLAGTSERGGGSATTLVSDIPSLEDSSFKVGRSSPEEKHQKILKYLRKRNERNYSKKIKYACRKTLADSRPRVRGRFAKNEELPETSRGKDDDEYDELFSKEEGYTEPIALMASLDSGYAIDPWV